MWVGLGGEVWEQPPSAVHRAELDCIFHLCQRTDLLLPLAGLRPADSPFDFAQGKLGGRPYMSHPNLASENPRDFHPNWLGYRRRMRCAHFRARPRRFATERYGTQRVCGNHVHWRLVRGYRIVPHSLR